MIRSHTQNGFTLIELLATLAILSILLGIAVPSFRLTIEKTRSDTITARIFHQYQLARDHAIDHRIAVHFCGTDDMENCQRLWHKNLVAFSDKNNNRLIEPEEIIHIEQFDDMNGSMITQAAFGLSHTILSPTGTAKLAGSIIYCPEDNDEKFARKVTWNRIGRLYKGWDKDGDGIVDGIDFSKVCTENP